ncbi:hypothetical protein J5N97_008263 [Dioscorea zingiberensis]|uniref:Pm52 protein n=1 Tax=Dioscorea zingiberensis TaxID=325984 RepID=A0A9D5DHU8_9LILI|nr:hypothetical protein J5N97_008263 [Dioscorea zingiberensis]
MAKYNVILKEKRARNQEKKRVIHGHHATRKLKQRAPPVSLSGKRKQKLFKKWRREQKEAIQKGLVTMSDVEMAVADGEGTSKNTGEKPQLKFSLKKASKLRIKKLKGKGKGKGKKLRTKPTEDAMVE